MKKVISLILFLFVLTSCSEKPIVNVDLPTLWTEVSEDYSDRLGSYELISATLLETLYSLSSEEVKQYAGIVPSVSVQAHEFLFVEAVNGKAETVKTAIEDRAKVLDSQWQGYLPEQHELVKNYTLIENGNYFFFIIHENKQDAIDIINSKFANG